jgi:putative hydrolase of the HAD superfamily
MIHAVLFDLDETLLDRTSSVTAFVADQQRRFAARLGHATAGSWCERFLFLDARGSVSKSVVYATLLAEFEGDLTVAHELLQDYRGRCALYALPFEGMAQTLNHLRSSGVPLGIVTNGETEFQTRHIEALGLSGCLDAVLISEQEGLRKPDRALFERAAARLRVAPTDCLFIGDNPTADILGAAAAGMHTAWFSPTAAWPPHLPAMPGTAIRAVPEVIALVERSRRPSPA